MATERIAAQGLLHQQGQAMELNQQPSRLYLRPTVRGRVIMPEANYANLFPQPICLQINELEKLISSMRTEAMRTLTVPLGPAHPTEGVELTFGVRGSLETDGDAIVHDIRTVAAETLLAAEILRRLGIYLEDVVRAAHPAIFGDPPSRPHYEMGYSNSMYAQSLFDLNNKSWDDIPSKVVFSVIEIRFASPGTFWVRVKGLLLAPIIAFLPIELSTPVVAAAAATVSAITAAGTLGYQIYLTREKWEDARRAEEARVYRELTMAPSKYEQIKCLQSYLGRIGEFNNTADGYWGPITNGFVVAYAKKRKLNWTKYDDAKTSSPNLDVDLFRIVSIDVSFALMGGLPPS